jgi:hypothetical protein
MTFRIDQTELEKFIETLLDAYKDGRAGRDTIVQLFARALMAGISGNEAEFQAYMRISEDTLPDR